MTEQLSSAHNAQEETQLERPDLGIESVRPGEPIKITESQMPWLHENVETPTVAITLESGQQVQYASVVGGNSTLRKLADHVPPAKSASAEAGLFKALPAWLSGTHPNIDFVPFVAGTENLYKVSKNGKDVARLVFAKIENEGIVTIVKVGISSHKEQQRMLSILSGGKLDRQKHDG